MVEFMYCGETTISHQHLSSLHAAAQIFKVKELVSVIDTIVDSKKVLDDFESCLKQQRGDCSLKVANNSLTEDDYVCVRCDKLSMDESTVICANSNNNDISSNKNQSLENDMIEGTEHDFEHTLYEEADAIDAKKDAVDTLFSTSDVNISIQNDNTTDTVSTHVGMINEVQTGCTSSNRDEVYGYSLDLKPILYEQCCDFSCDINESDQTTSILSQSCLPQVENDFEHCSGSSTDVPSTVGKYVKVYTPKRRRSMDDVRNKLVHTQCNLVPTPPHSTDSIDLLDEPSANDLPVTLLTSLDMESAEYILSLSTESIQSIVGGTISDQHTVIGCRETSVERDAAKERLNSPTNDTDCAKPVLRRSTRLSQQENDEAANNSLFSGSSPGTEKLFKKGNSPNRTELKAKRKGKEDRKVPDHSALASAVQSSKKSSNSKKTNSKLIVRKSNKSACTVAGNKEREESKPKTSSRFKTENTDRSPTADQPAAYHSSKSNVCKCISRALWGDMSDALDYWENDIDLLAYPSNTEIPFAVGLLPLRTALEKMQATPDYQPRKTRSSVAPMKQDSSNSLKRKYCTPSDAVVLSKKQNGSNAIESSNSMSVCHIEIRTAPSQCVKNRKRFLSDSITSLPADGPTTQAMTSNNVG
ncbi:uncharacterized protein LOC105831041 isoform X2 [Monomorium pharaonis]|nr:uncharacterized protein LOC105831041 isoform X2 [Monomorium pharaonis]XP_028049187.1 uncharacterized protein LOC105831041 isoform X2 [Monomorium pharaonis]XP_028049188.1 uncharacterized protein LOC105831041 isoform X2 [Monomorium pharaonis]XP_036147790.1 uncharacterized protein LOC105831041 isoform X2 [Monomorium pharaonis]XP_036147791.1 uncharacterized protein LOC105831041 isoform X2 [Monomorium pharaonis]